MRFDPLKPLKVIATPFVAFLLGCFWLPMILWNDFDEVYRDIWDEEF